MGHEQAQRFAMSFDRIAFPAIQHECRPGQPRLTLPQAHERREFGARRRQVAGVNELRFDADRRRGSRDDGQRAVGIAGEGNDRILFLVRPRLRDRLRLALLRPAQNRFV